MNSVLVESDSCGVGCDRAQTTQSHILDKIWTAFSNNCWASSHFSLAALSRPFSKAFCASFGAAALVALMVKPSTWPIRCKTNRPTSALSNVDILLVRSIDCDVNPANSACSSQLRQSRWFPLPVLAALQDESASAALMPALAADKRLPNSKLKLR